MKTYEVNLSIIIKADTKDEAWQKGRDKADFLQNLAYIDVLVYEPKELLVE